MATPAQLQAPQIVEVPLALFGGMHTGVAPSDLPEGLSPDNQDMAYVPGETFSRPALSRIFGSPLTSGAALMYEKTYVLPDGTPLTLALDSTGILWVENVNASPGTATQLTTITPGVSALSASAFGREYIAISDLLHGQWVPLQYDGTYLDRVTQDGPGAGPTISNLVPPTATISNSGAGSAFTITSVTPSDPVITYTTRHDPEGGREDVTITTYTSLTIVVTSSISGTILVDTTLAITGVTPAYFDQTTACIAVVNSTTFKIAYHSQSTATGTGGTATVQQTTLTRIGNIVTATTAAPHGFQPGWQVNVLIANTSLVNVSAVTRDGNGNVTVTTASAHGLPIGATVALSGVTNPDTSFNTSPTGVPVASVPSATTFTFAQGGTAESSTGATGAVYDVWIGTFFIQSVPTPTTFTYQDIGPNDLTNASGTAACIGQISPGAHNFVVSFLTRQGALTKPSPPVTLTANGAQQAFFQQLPIGPSNIVARVISATGAGGDNYFTIPATPQVGGQIVGTSLVIPDNTSTSAVIDFNDNTLFAGIAIDQIGNDLFDQRLLIAPVGFYSYSSRLLPWGDYNAVQNLLNMTFGGGIDYTPFTMIATTGINSGSGTAWTNPSYIADTGTSNYASVSVSSADSQALKAEGFGFAVADPVNNTITVNFNYYWTAGGVGIPSLGVQLLKAGVAVGTAQGILLVSTFGGNQGSATSPLTANLVFPNPGLLAADINGSTFGFQIRVISPGASTAVHLNSGYTSVSEVSQPLGWSTSGSTSLTGVIAPSTLPGIYQVYQMLSAGGISDCLLSQSAYQDASGTSILLPNTQYSIRALAFQSGGATRGNLVWDFYSPTQGQLASASIPASGLDVITGNPGFSTASFNIATPSTIPADTLFRLYLSGVDPGVTVSIAENALFYQANPYTANTALASYVLNPEGIAQTTGLLGSADDPSPVMCFSVQRNVTLLKSYAGTHTFQDNGDEPYTWQVNNLSRSVGACSIRSGDPGQFGTGDAAEDWDITANQNGLYLFAGGDFWKISQELDLGDPANPVPTWQNIDWSYEQTIWVKNDPRTHRIYIGAPLVGATQPNVVWVLDYKELDTGTDLSSGPSLKIGLTGKMLSTDKTRKWTRWNVSANSADILIRPGNEKEMTFGGGYRNNLAYGNLYTLDPTKLTDDDYGQIAPYYDTYFFVNHELEQALGIGAGRKFLRKISAFITGVGYVSIIPFVNSLQNPLPATSVRLLAADSDPSNLQNQDLEWTTGVRGDRICLRIQVEPFPGSTDVQLKIQKIIAYMMKDPVIVHRSSAV